MAVKIKKITAAAAAMIMLTSCGETVSLMESAPQQSRSGDVTDVSPSAETDRSDGYSDADISESTEGFDEVEPTTVNVYDTSFELPSSYVIEGFETVLQKPELPAGCEVVSLTQTLNFLGFDVDKITMADDFMPIDYQGNVIMDEAYIGDPRSDGFGCDANVIVQTADKYFASVDSPCYGVDLTGTDLHDLFYQLASGRPVIIWVTVDLTIAYPYFRWIAGNGKEFYFNSYQHCITIYGYDTEQWIIYAADPLVGNITYPMETFEQVYDIMGKQAAVIVGDSSTEGHHVTTDAERSVTMLTRSEKIAAGEL